MKRYSKEEIKELMEETIKYPLTHGHERIGINRSWMEFIRASFPIIQQLLSDNEELIKMGEFYENKKFYHDDNPHPLSGTFENTCSILMDEGKLARTTLEKVRMDK